MFKVTQEILDELSSTDGLKLFTDENAGSSRVWLQFKLESGPSYRISFINTDDRNDVAMRVFGLAHVTESQLDKVYPVLNEINNKFRFLKFVCDNDGDINAEYDYPVESVDPAASAREMIIRATSIIDEAYPVLMRAIWS